MLTQADFTTLMAKPGVFDRLPELRPMQQQPAPAEPRRPCRNCVKRRAEKNLFSMFMGIVVQLNDEAKSRLKKELGAESLLIYAYSKDNGRYEMRQV